VKALFIVLVEGRVPLEGGNDLSSLWTRLIEQLLWECGLVERIIAEYRCEQAYTAGPKRRPPRVGYMGHLHIMCSVICELGHRIPECGARLSSADGWSDIVFPSVEAVLHIHKGCLGGHVSDVGGHIAPVSDLMDAGAPLNNIQDISQDNARIVLGAASLSDSHASDAIHDSSSQNDIPGYDCGVAHLFCIDTEIEAGAGPLDVEPECFDDSPDAFSSLADFRHQLDPQGVGPCLFDPVLSTLESTIHEALSEQSHQDIDGGSFWNANLVTLPLNSAAVSDDRSPLFAGVDDTVVPSPVPEAVESTSPSTNFGLQEPITETTCVPAEPASDNEDMLDIFEEGCDPVGAGGPAEVAQQNGTESPMLLLKPGDTFSDEVTSQSKSSSNILQALNSTNPADISGCLDNRSCRLSVGT